MRNNFSSSLRRLGSQPALVGMCSEAARYDGGNEGSTCMEAWSVAAGRGGRDVGW